MTYTSRNQLTLIDTEKAAKGFDPMAGAGLSLDFIVSDVFFIGVNGGYGLFVESKRVIQYATCGVNLGVRF
jgi:hypothetical protein